jgi:hypothetical protein
LDCIELHMESYMTRTLTCANVLATADCNSALPVNI